MTKDNIFREVRKLVDILNCWGNCLVPSIHEDGSAASAKERLSWVIEKAKKEHDLSTSDIESGIAGL